MSSGARLQVVRTDTSSSWRAALEQAVREEFLGPPLVLPEGSSLLPPTCGVDGCPRPGDRTAWGRFDTRLCHAHWTHWAKAGRPVAKDAWLSAQQPPEILRPLTPCMVKVCSRSAATTGLCGAHRRQWTGTGRPDLQEFASSAGAAATEASTCLAPGCGYPVVPGRAHHGLCDQHLARFHAWRHKHVKDGDQDPSIERYVESLVVRVEGMVRKRLWLPDAPVLALELRFVLQHRHDHGDGLIFERRWREMLEQLNALQVRSLLDHDRDWWNARRTGEGRVPKWMNFVNYALPVLLAFRARTGLRDPWTGDVWDTRALPIDQVPRRICTLDWRAIDPTWLRELCKRWARHRLRHGLSTGTVNTVRLAVVRLVEFCDQAGWPLDAPACLTRELFDAFLDHVRSQDRGWAYKRQITAGVKQLFEETHDLGWIRLRNPRVYLPGELPDRGDYLPRALPAEIVKRLNEPEALELLGIDERAAALVLMDCGLRATDTTRLRVDGVLVGSDGAPYLRYWNHKRRREAIVPISDRAAEAIAAQQAWVREHFPGCEWLFPRPYANGRGKQPMGYGFIFNTLGRWSRALDLRDAHGKRFQLRAHDFRHSYATGLVNNDVDLYSVQSLLDHDSPEMTWRYARLSKETLRRKWEQGQQRINIRGEVVPLDINGELSDAAWAKEQISRAKQSLANGWCGLPLQQTCPHPNACLTCPAFLTDQTFLAQHREQLARTERLIELGKANGNQRLVEINEATRVNLIAIIERAEQLEQQAHDDERREGNDAAA